MCWQNADAMTPSTGIDDSNSDEMEAEEAEADGWIGPKQRDGSGLVGCRMCVLGEDSRGQ